jgi:hypothetical protein
MTRYESQEPNHRQSANGQCAFPTFRVLPDYYHDNEPCIDPLTDNPVPHWCFFGEITTNASLVRPVYHIRDREGRTIVLGLYLDDYSQFDKTKYKVGYTICILYARSKEFADGSIGIRVEDLNTLQGTPSCLSYSIQCFHVLGKM